jgi:hypothetical protein
MVVFGSDDDEAIGLCHAVGEETVQMLSPASSIIETTSYCDRF